MRWKIELFNNILKSGCKVERCRLRAASRLVNLIGTCCILDWRISWVTMVWRSSPGVAPTLALTQLELELFDRMACDKPSASCPPKDLSVYFNKIARLCGYLDRSSDPSPGIIVMWRGLARLTDLANGFSIANEKCG